MSLNDFVNNLEQCATDMMPHLADIYEKALQNMDEMIHSRIFNEHLDVNDSKIGTYSTKTTLIGAKSFKNKTNASNFFKSEKTKRNKTKGNSEESKWRTVGSKHLFLLDGGYKQLRTLQGMQSGEVDFKYTSELLNRGIIQRISGGLYQLVFNNKLNEDKARGYEKRKGKKIFYLSENEEKKTIEYIGGELNQTIKECLGL